MKRYVIDSYAMVAFFENEPGASVVEKVLQELFDSKARAWMSVVNWGEVYYNAYREQGQETAESTLRQLEKYPIEIVPADQDLTKAAAVFKGEYRIAYADCFAAALAKKMKAIVLTGDPEFKVLEKEVKVRWIAPR